MVTARKSAKDLQLVELLDTAVAALNAAAAAAKRRFPGATLYLESDGTLYVLAPEPESHRRRDTTMGERQSLILLKSTGFARCDVGAW